MPPQVRKTHTEGGYGSIGYQYKWNRAEADKNLLRTHTTSVSARMLHKLAQVLKILPLISVFKSLLANRHMLFTQDLWKHAVLLDICM